MSKLVKFTIVNSGITLADNNAGYMMGIAGNLKSDPRADNVDYFTQREYMGGEGTDDNYTHPEDVWLTHFLTFTCSGAHAAEMKEKIEDLIADIEPPAQLFIGEK